MGQRTRLGRRTAGVFIVGAILLAACGTGTTDDSPPPAGRPTDDPAAPSGAPTDDATPPSGDPIRIGVAFGITGSSTFVSGQGVQGVELAVSELNAAGGVLGRPIELVIQDTECQPAEGVNAARRLIEVENTRLLIGGQCSSETLAIMPVVQELEAVLINSMSTAPSITEQSGIGGNPWVFRVNPPDSSFAPALARAIVDEHGHESIAIVAVNDDLGRGAAEEFTRAFDALGASVVIEEFYQREGTHDFTATLTAIRASEAEAVVFVGTIEPGVPFIRQSAELQLTQDIYTRGLSLTTQLFEELGDLVDGVHSTEPYYAEIDGPENERFVEAFRAMHQTDPVYQAYTAYEAVNVYAQAIEAAGSIEPADVRDALEELSYEVVTGTIEFDEYHQAWTDIYVARVVCDPDCRVEIVETVPSRPDF